MNLPVTIIGVGPGFSFGFDGPTHHGTQDVAIMRSLPEITIYNLSDITLAIACAQMAYESNGPVYVRLDKGKFPVFANEDKDFSEGFRTLKPLRETNIVSTGFMTCQALALAEELEKRSIDVGVVDLYRLKPISSSILSKVIDHSKEIVTIEESSIVGGLGSIMCELLGDHHRNIPVWRIAARDHQFLDYGSREWFHTINGLDVPNLVEWFLNKKPVTYANTSVT
jgi:transketolase